jgi:hypothetical protein
MDDSIVLASLATLVNGKRDRVPGAMMLLMDVTDDGVIQWIPFHTLEVLGRMKSVTKSDGNLSAPRGGHLNAIIILLSNFKVAKTRSGEARESLAMLILLFRAMTGQAHTAHGTNEIAIKKPE